MRPILATFITIFFSSQLNAQSLEHLPLDSLMQWVNENARTIYENGNTTQVHHYAYLCLTRAKEQAAIDHIIEASQNLAMLHYMMEDKNVPDSSLFYDQLALEYLLRTDDKVAIAKAYNYVAGDYLGLDDYENAQANYLKSLEVREELNDQKGMAKVYSDLSFLYAHSEDHERAVQYGEKGIEAMETMSAPDSIDLGIAWFYLVRSYIKLEQFDKALQASQNSVKLLEPYADEAPFALMKAYAFRGEAYQALREYEKALADYYHAWEFGKSKVADENTVGGYQQGIAAVLRLQGKFEEAIPYYEGFFTTMIERDAYDDLDLANTNLELADCYEQIGAYAKANKHHKIAAQLKDTLATERYENLESELIQKYESDQKDERIALQTATIQQQKQIQWLSIGLAGLLALLLAGLFFTYRRNQKTNTLLQNLNTDLAQKNQQNELLLKEIHHRVKNNLQTISSLLSLQSAHIENPEVQGAVEQSQNRVRSMALIHQKLYQGENLAAVEMKEYLQMLGETIVDTFGVDSEQIEIEYPMEQVELDVDTAIPLGLIANELLTNALKYAFPDHRKGKIKVSLQRIGERFKFLVKDNGIGLSQNADAPKSGFGSQLINLLVMQMGGKMERQSRNGLVTEIEFSLT
ncbi:MAG: histidine kinase dimerization/phosphoacceptor domain -containing protein [Bacteroidota bacterium]